MPRPVGKDLQVNDYRPRWLTANVGHGGNAEPQMTQICAVDRLQDRADE